MNVTRAHSETVGSETWQQLYDHEFIHKLSCSHHVFRTRGLADQDKRGCNATIGSRSYWFGLWLSKAYLLKKSSMRRKEKQITTVTVKAAFLSGLATATSSDAWQLFTATGSSWTTWLWLVLSFFGFGCYWRRKATCIGFLSSHFSQWHLPVAGGNGFISG